MPTTVQQMLAAANASVPKLSPSEASEKIKAESTLILDVRDLLQSWGLAEKAPWQGPDQTAIPNRLATKVA